MPNSRKKDGLIMQAGILAIAGIIVRIIGLLYNSPMNAILGDEGMGYYNTAYYAYTIVLLISSYSIPSAISKVIAQKLAVREYRNAHRIFQCALIYVLVVGSIAGLFVFFGAGLLVQIDNAIPALRVLAPTIFLSGILGVLRGYFQAHKTMVQTSVSQILEQLLNAGFSIWLAYVLMNSFALRGQSESYAMGAAGGAIGTGIGVLTALLFMVAIYGLNKQTIQRRIKRDTHKDETWGSIFKMIFQVVTPFILSTFIYNANTFINQTIYQSMMIYTKGYTDTMVAAHTGIVGKPVKISNIPIALASAMASALIPGISGDYARGDKKGARQKVDRSMKVTMLISIPAAVGIGVLSKPIMWVLYPQRESIELASMLLTVLAVSVVFYAISTLSNAVLQSIGKLNIPVINAAIALVLQTGALVAMIYFLDPAYGPYYYMIAIIVYSLSMCILNGVAVRKHLEYRQEIDKTFLRPTLSSVVMGIVVFLIYHGLHYLIPVNVLALGVSVVVGAMVYFVLVIRWKAVTEEELISMPKGYMIAGIARKIGILKDQTDKPVHRKNRKKNNKNKAKQKKTKIKNQKKVVKESDADFWLDDE